MARPSRMRWLLQSTNNLTANAVKNVEVTYKSTFRWTELDLEAYEILSYHCGKMLILWLLKTRSKVKSRA